MTNTVLKAVADDSHAAASFIMQTFPPAATDDATNTTSYILAVLTWLQISNPSLQGCSSRALNVVGTTTSVEFSVCDYLGTAPDATPVMVRIAARAMGLKRAAVTYHARPSQFPPTDWDALVANLALSAS